MKYRVLLLSILISSTSLAAETAPAGPRMVKMYRQLLGIKTVPAANKVRLQMAQDLLNSQLYESALLYIYQIIKSKDASSAQAAVRIMDRLIEKTGQRSLYKLVPAELDQKFYSNAYRSFLLNEKTKELVGRKDFGGAEKLVRENSNLPTLMARYSLASAYLTVGDYKNAAKHFESIYNEKLNSPINDRQRSLAILGLARAAYQGRQWMDAVQLYREIPKDNPFYRQSLLELSWALFRAGQFRSALSPLHTLHSDFYDGFYQPESLYLRGVILLFTCRYSEADLAVNLFDKTYKNSYFQIRKWLQDPEAQKRDIKQLFDVVESVAKHTTEEAEKRQSTLPFFILRASMDEPEMDVLLRRQKLLTKERSRIDQTLRGNSALKKQISTFVVKRMQRNEAYINTALKSVVINYAEQTEGWFTLMDLMRLEVIEGQKNRAKAKMYRPDEGQDITSEMSRTFFIQNGYRFWPFQGEYWRDEIGNYQFIGASQCTSEDLND